MVYKVYFLTGIKKARRKPSSHSQFTYYSAFFEESKPPRYKHRCIHPDILSACIGNRGKRGD